MGSGRYSEKLSYYDWYRFNNAQRNHYNFLENFALQVVSLLIGGIYYPIQCTAITVVDFVARIMYAFYLTDKGASNPIRSLGSTLSFVCTFGAVGFGFASSFKILGGDLIEKESILSL